MTDTVETLVADVREYVSARVELAKAVATLRLREARSGIVFAVAAAVIGISTFGAMLVGLILALSTLIGPGLATLAVTLVGFAVAGVLGWIGVGHLSRAMGAEA